MRELVHLSAIHFPIPSMKTKHSPRPPLGWNSYDCFGSAVTEKEVCENAAFMAANLKGWGWEYVVVDFCWSHPSPGACANPNIGHGCTPLLHTDLNGRLIPAPNRFPSSAGGMGFKPLADYVHGLGLKFGIHVMRGIPKQVCTDHVPIEGSEYTTIEASTSLLECTWLDHMLTVNTKHPAGQAYYDSLFRLYAAWGVDFVKVDDILADGSDRGLGPYHASEVEAIRLAIERCGRPMVLSLSPGDASVASAGHLSEYADMWRMSADFWDDWKKLKRMFGLCERWWGHRVPGAWPDADMLPLGRICKRGPKTPERNSRFTESEQRVLLSLWSIFRSPLMLGGHLPETSLYTIGLLKNKEVMDVNQLCLGGRPVAGMDSAAPVWVSRYPDSADQAVALFNLGETAHSFSVSLKDLDATGASLLTNLWTGETSSIMKETLEVSVPPHDVCFLRLAVRP